MDNLGLFQLLEPQFSHSVWQRAQVLLLGAILGRGQRTVCAVLCIMGPDQERLLRTTIGCSIERRGRVRRSVGPCCRCWSRCWSPKSR